MNKLNHTRRLQLKGMTAILLARQAPAILTARNLVVVGTAAVTATATEDADAVAASALAIVLGVISAGSAIFSAMWSTRKAHESQVALAQMQRDTQMMVTKMQQDFELRRASLMQIDGRGVSQEHAFERANTSQLARTQFTSNIDGYSTYVGMSQGLMAAERDHYGGVMSNTEAERAAGVFADNGVMPVPVQDYYRTPSRNETEACLERWAKRSGRSVESIKNEVAPFCIRDYSRARYPTASAADLRFVGVINKKKPLYDNTPTVDFLVA